MKSTKLLGYTDDNNIIGDRRRWKIVKNFNVEALKALSWLGHELMMDQGALPKYFKR